MHMLLQPYSQPQMARLSEPLVSYGLSVGSTGMWCCRNTDCPGDLRVQLCGGQEVAGLQEARQPGGEGRLRGLGRLLQGLRREWLPRRCL